MVLSWLATGKRVRLEGTEHSALVRDLQLSGDGARIAGVSTAGDGEHVSVWDAQSGQGVLVTPQPLFGRSAVVLRARNPRVPRRSWSQS